MNTGAETVTVVAWLTAGIATLLGSGLALEPSSAVLLLALLMLSFGIWAFLHHGGPRVTAAGLFCAASGVFVGYGGLWWRAHLGEHLPPTMLSAVASAYFATVLMYALFWRGTNSKPIPSSIDPVIARQAVVAGYMATFAGLTADLLFTNAFTPVMRGLAFIGIILTTIGMTGIAEPFRLRIRSICILSIPVVAFVAISFTGFGRLTVVALVSAIAIIITNHQRSRLLKILAVALVPVGISILTRIRAGRLGTSRGAEDPDSEVSGIWTFVRLIEQGDSLEHGYGETVWSALVVWIPRQIWPDKPLGFGAELTLMLEPQLAQAGHSMVSTVFGEAYYNFGWAGIAILILIVGLLVRLLDRLRELAAGSRLDSMARLLITALLVSLIATIPDLAWGGSFAFASRTLFRVIAVAGLLVLYAYGGTRRRRQVGNSSSRIRRRTSS